MQAGNDIFFEIYGHSGLRDAASFGVVIRLPLGVKFRNYSASGAFANGVPIGVQNGDILTLNVVILGGRVSVDSGIMGTVKLTILDTFDDNGTGFIDLQSAIVSDEEATIRNSRITLTSAISGTSITAPTNLQATYNANNTPSDVSLSWTAPSSFDSFLIQRAEVTAGGSSTNLTYTLYPK